MRYLTAGESHGEVLSGLLEGFPAGVGIDVRIIEKHLARRRNTAGRSQRQEQETDRIKILSGLSKGISTGAPVALILSNRARGKVSFNPVPIPGHADLPGAIKYRIEPGIVRERASARETAIRVALGCFPMLLLKKLGISICSRTVSLGTVADFNAYRSPARKLSLLADKSPVRCPDMAAGKKMLAEITAAASKKDTLGGVFEVRAEGVPPGLGSHAHHDRKLDALLAAQFMGLNAVKGVEIGGGFYLAQLRGSSARDAFHADIPFGRETNHAGGIEGGISNGETIVVRAAVKPLPGSEVPVRSVNLRTGKPAFTAPYRSDTCAVPAAGIIGEFLLAFVLSNVVLEKFGSDTFSEISSRLEEWRRFCRSPWKK
ncbi:MAG: chorismate synthase [bacterium]